MADLQLMETTIKYCGDKGRKKEPCYYAKSKSLCVLKPYYKPSQMGSAPPSEKCPTLKKQSISCGLVDTLRRRMSTEVSAHKNLD